MLLRYDIHLSAYTIARKTIVGFEELGFTRDLFTNNTRCETTAYHGTYRGSAVLPNDSLWAQLVALIGDDESFVGGLEQESYSTEDIRQIATNDRGSHITIAPFALCFPRPGHYKRCDIHVNMSLEKSSPESVSLVERLGLASFDKPQSDGVHRVCSITCDDLSAGAILTDALCEYLSRIPHLSVKVKFERTDRFLRVPDDAPTLPLLDAESVMAWVASLKLPGLAASSL